VVKLEIEINPYKMDRRKFFSKLGLGAVAVVAAPLIVKAVEEKPSVTSQLVPILDKQQMEWARYASRTGFVITTKPVRMSADQLYDDRIVIQIDRQLRLNDTVYLDPNYTNKEIPAMYQVMPPEYVIQSAGRREYNYSIQPLDPTVKLVCSIRKGATLLVGSNLNVESPIWKSIYDADGKPRVWEEMSKKYRLT